MAEEHLVKWATFANDQQKIGAKLSGLTGGWTGLNTDPRLFSCQLFHRLWAHIRAFNLLFSHRLTDDAEIVLRSAVEVAICFASLNSKPVEFVAAVREDAASTTRGQVPLWTQADAQLGADATANIDAVFGAPADGKKHRRLNFSALADAAGVARLHDWHKHLSATAVHVTGLSLMKSVDDSLQNEWKSVRRGYALGQSCAVFQLGMTVHAEMIEASEIAAELAALAQRLATLEPPESG